jgi:hypothetical protein
VAVGSTVGVGAGVAIATEGVAIEVGVAGTAVGLAPAAHPASSSALTRPATGRSERVMAFIWCSSGRVM